MKLRISIDLNSTEDALALADAVAPYADVLEAGTPLIKQVGLGIVAERKRRHPDKRILADLEMKYNRVLMMAVLHERIAIAKAINVKVLTLDEAPVACKFVIDLHGSFVA